MKTFKRIGAKGALVLVMELPRQKKHDPQYEAQCISAVTGLGCTGGWGDSIEEAVDAACGL